MSTCVVMYTAEGEVTLTFYIVQGTDAAWLVATNTMPPTTAGLISSGDAEVISGISNLGSPRADHVLLVFVFVRKAGEPITPTDST